ncbi:hypothetical protein [Jiella mangrovi]|uniref:Uncharacterized protein n=1 Tax=Jiella mangrovi TaxID=2821407 RepID=A0ABS4BNV0_9HYPH|nr:hypothetical protein [Jiella mangrovi]MBP0617810.1 hypothetical protein [Jiella mangrovi]
MEFVRLMHQLSVFEMLHLLDESFRLGFDHSQHSFPTLWLKYKGLAKLSRFLRRVIWFFITPLKRSASGKGLMSWPTAARRPFSSTVARWALGVGVESHGGVSR